MFLFHAGVGCKSCRPPAENIYMSKYLFDIVKIGVQYKKSVLYFLAINASLISSAAILLQLLSVLKCVLKISKLWENRRG